MDKKTAMKEWRDAMRNAPDGVVTPAVIHAFAQRVEALTIARCDKRHAEVLSAGNALSNIAFNLEQRVGHTISAGDSLCIDTARRNWDAAVMRKESNHD